MDNLNAEQIKKAAEYCWILKTCKDCPYDCGKDNYHCVNRLKQHALALINSQEQRIEELTQAHEQLSESYNHLEKTKDELIAERSRLAEENAKIGMENFDLICKLSRIKEDAVWKMQERLKMYFGTCVLGYKIPLTEALKAVNQIAKEMLEDRDEN